MLPRRVLFVILITGILLIVLLSHRLISARRTSDGALYTTSAKAQKSNRPANLHLLITAHEATTNFCRLMLSASVLGYPSPVAIGWGGSGGNYTAGVHEYLSHLNDEHADDVVLLVDSETTWLQLRPQTLIDRFHDVNHRANDRVREQLGWSVDNTGVRQEIIFATRNSCPVDDNKDPICYATPQPSAYEDIYGQRKDNLAPKKGSFNLAAHQPQFMDPTIAVGSVKSMKRLFAHAIKSTESEGGKTHQLLLKSFADQSLSRHMLKSNLRAAMTALRNNLRGHTPDSNVILQHLKDVRARGGGDGGTDLQFGIGLDFGGELSQIVETGDPLIDWTVAQGLGARRASSGEDEAKRKADESNLLPRDIVETLPPFWTHTVEELPRWRKWQEVPLLINVTRGSIPVAIHHTSAADSSDWSKMWFHKDARTLLDAYIYAPIVPIAMGGPAAHLREYWPYEIWKGGARQDLADLGSNDGWLRIDQVCEKHHEAMFGDGLGAWQLPANH